VLRSLRDLTLGLPYGSHPPWSDQPHLFATVWSSSSIRASWHPCFEHLILHLYWLSLMSRIGNFSRVVSGYSNNLELCAQVHCNYNTSSCDNMQQCDQHCCMSNTWLSCWNFQHFFDQIHFSMPESVLDCRNLSYDLQIFLLMYMKYSFLVDFFDFCILGLCGQTHCRCSISMCDVATTCSTWLHVQHLTESLGLPALLLP